MVRLFCLLLLFVLVSCGEQYKLKVDTYSEMDGEFVSTNVLEFDIDTSTKEDAIKEAKLQCRTLYLMYESARKSGAYAFKPTMAILYTSSGDLVDYIDIESEEVKPVRKMVIDSVKVDKMKSLFEFTEDEFSIDGTVWIKPKTAPKYVNRNGIFCYFKKTEKGVDDLRLRIQYYADEWLFIKKYNFAIDGEAYELIPDNVETDSGNGGKIWEWVDISVSNKKQKDLVQALSSAKEVKIKFTGTQYYKVKSVSLREIRSIKETLEFYKAIGGDF